MNPAIMCFLVLYLNCLSSDIAPPAMTSAFLNKSLLANSITSRPARALSSPFSTKATFSRSSPTAEAPSSITPTIDIIDLIRKELRARQKPSPRPFAAPGKIFKKRNSQWELVDSSSAKIPSA